MEQTVIYQFNLNGQISTYLIVAKNKIREYMRKKTLVTGGTIQQTTSKDSNNTFSDYCFCLKRYKQIQSSKSNFFILPNYLNSTMSKYFFSCKYWQQNSPYFLNNSHRFLQGSFPNSIVMKLHMFKRLKFHLQT